MLSPGEHMVPHRVSSAVSSVSGDKLRSIVDVQQEVRYIIELGESSHVWLAGKVLFVYVDVSKPHVAVRAEHLASSGSHSAAHSSPDPGTGLSKVCGYLQSRLIFMPQWKAYTGCGYHSVIAAEAIIAMLHFPAGQVFQNNLFNIPR